MSSIKQWDWTVQNAGVFNVASFLDNVAAAIGQELDMLKSSAASGDAINSRYCPACHKAIDEVLCADDDIDLHLSRPLDGPPYFRLEFTCPFCREELNAHIILVNIEKWELPF